AGVESAVADHVMRLRDRLRAARYGPRGLGDAAELAAELAQVLKVLDAEPAGGRHRRWLVAVCLGHSSGPLPCPGSRWRRRRAPKRSTISERCARPPTPSRLEPRPGRAWRRTGTTSARRCIAPGRTERPPLRGRSPHA